MVMHSISDHALNLPSRNEVENYLKNLENSKVREEKQYYKYTIQDIQETLEKANNTKKLQRSLVSRSRYMYDQCEER